VLREVLFEEWEWGSEVQSFVSDSQTAETLEDFDGDRRQAFSDAMHWLGSPGKCGIFRTKTLYEYNPGIGDRLVGETPPIIDFVPAAIDAGSWLTLVKMYLVSHHTSLSAIDFGSERGSKHGSKYDIRKVVQQFSLSCRRPNNADSVRDHLFSSPVFRDKFKFTQVPTEKSVSHASSLILGGVEVEILDRHAAEAAITQNQSFLSGDSMEEIPHQDVRLTYQLEAAYDPLEDPRRYVELIPWEELSPISPVELIEAGISISLPYDPSSTVLGSSSQNHSPHWMLWRIPSHNVFDSHLLHTEDEVYQYCVLHSWYFPGHALQDHVVFAASPLENTEFVRDLKQFWDNWVRIINFTIN
jgi:hypothetical protein